MVLMSESDQQQLASFVGSNDDTNEINAIITSSKSNNTAKISNYPDSPTSVVGMHSLGVEARKDATTTAGSDDDKSGNVLTKKRELLLDPNQFMKDQSLLPLDHSVSNAGDGGMRHTDEFATGATTNESHHVNLFRNDSSSTNVPPSVMKQGGNVRLESNTSITDDTSINNIIEESSYALDSDKGSLDFPSLVHKKNSSNNNDVKVTDSDNAKDDDNKYSDCDDDDNGDKEEEEEDHMEISNAMIDAELEKAVQTALLKTTDSMSSAASHSSWNLITDVHDYGSGDDDDSRRTSVFSSNSMTHSVNTVKSAVQLRLEQREKPAAPTMESFQAKLDAAEQRKLYFLEGIMEKSRRQHKRISSARSLMEDEHATQIGTLRMTLNEKITSATERKDVRMRDMMTQLRKKNTKALGTRSSIQEQSIENAMVLRKKLDTKLQEANQKKQQSMMKFSEKMQAKMTRITEAKENAKSAIEEMGKKLSEKLEAATSRNVEHNDNRRRKATQGDGQTFYHDKDDGGGDNYDDDDDVSLKKQALYDKLSSAAKRKEAILKQRQKKATEYLQATYQRGQQMKQNESLLQNNTQFPTYDIIRANSSSLASIQEDKEYDSIGDDIALQWLQNENDSVNSSISSVGITHSKSKVQKRLESYVRMTPSLSQVNDKLDAASRRRKTILQNTKDKADTKVMFGKIEEKILLAETRVKALSENLNQKMEIAKQRKEAYIEKIQKGKALATSSKLQKVQANLAIRDAKIFEMQQRLEAKLITAYERKERMIAVKSASASSDVSSSTERASIVSHRKEMLINEVRLKSEIKLESASSRRKQLRDLEKQKQEVLMLRREIAKSTKADSKLKLAQKKIQEKMASAHARKELFLAARKAKAAEHLLSSTDRGLEIVEMTEIKKEETKARVEQKLESAEKRRLIIAQNERKKRERQRERHQKALEIGLQRRDERNAISSWDEVSLPTVVETEEFVGVPIDNLSKHNEGSNLVQADECSSRNNIDDSYDGINRNCSYDEQYHRAKQQLVEEIRLANTAKLKEMEYLTKQLKKPVLGRDMSVSAESFGTLDSNEVLSFDENDMDISISGLSTIREHEKITTENKKAQAALALAELDIKLSEIQLMQAILLAEEASLSGKTEFKTSDQSVEDLNRVKVKRNFFENENKNTPANHRDRIKSRARSFLSSTLQQAKVAKDKAGKTLLGLKSKIELSELERKEKRKNG